MVFVFVCLFVSVFFLPLLFLNPIRQALERFGDFAFVSAVDLSSVLIFEFNSSRANIYPKNVGMLTGNKFPS